VSRPLPAPGRALGAVPRLADLVERPELVSSLPAAAAGVLLAQITPLQTALLVRILGAVSGPSGTDHCISVPAAAQRLGVSRGFIYKHKATLPFVRQIGSRIRCSEAGVTAWLQGQRPA
jgi:excisionase family DNA binding protein